jgi:hypothetical protein
MITINDIYVEIDNISNISYERKTFIKKLIGLNLERRKLDDYILRYHLDEHDLQKGYLLYVFSKVELIIFTINHKAIDVILISDVEVSEIIFSSNDINTISAKIYFKNGKVKLLTYDNKLKKISKFLSETIHLTQRII